MPNTQIDKEANPICVLARTLWNNKAINDHEYRDVMIAAGMPGFATPLPAEGESSPKPEAGEQRVLRWGCEIVFSCGRAIVRHGATPELDENFDLHPDGGWAKTGTARYDYAFFDNQDAAIAALNACTTPPPGWKPERVLKCCDCYTPFTSPPIPQAWCHKCNKWKVPAREDQHRSEYQKTLETPEGRIELCTEQTITNVTELICTHLETSGMTRTELARHMEVTPARITQLLDGDANLTLRSIARALAAFGHVLSGTSNPIERTVPAIGEEVRLADRCVNVRCNACDRSLLGVNCCDTKCERNDCGLRPINAMRNAVTVFAPNGYTIPDWQPHSSVTSPSTSHESTTKVGDDKPEAGEQRVLGRDGAIQSLASMRDTLILEGDKKAAGMINLCIEAILANPLPTPQPAEPKVMSPQQCAQMADYLSVLPLSVHPPQPSEQAKGAEPSNMAKRLTNKLWLSHLGMDVIRNYALEIDAAFESQHKAEMEAVKKGASR